MRAQSISKAQANSLSPLCCDNQTTGMQSEKNITKLSFSLANFLFVSAFQRAKMTLTRSLK